MSDHARTVTRTYSGSFPLWPALVGLLLLCSSPVTAGAETPAAPSKTGAVLFGYISQGDAVDRSGGIKLRKVDASGLQFLPATRDNVATFRLTPAFRFSEILRGDLIGRTRARPKDLAILDLSPGTWAIEVATTTHRYHGGSTTLGSWSEPELLTLGFVVREGSLVLLPAVKVSPGAMSVVAEDTTDNLTELASARKLNVSTTEWVRMRIQCQIKRAVLDGGPIGCR